MRTHLLLLTVTQCLLLLLLPAPPCLCLKVMGLLQGKVQDDTFVVIDSFALPVEGTETRVNAQAEAYEYMVDFQGTSKVCCAVPCCAWPRALRRGAAPKGSFAAICFSELLLQLHQRVEPEIAGATNRHRRIRVTQGACNGCCTVHNALASNTFSAVPQ